jgi:hypothetical protein
MLIIDGAALKNAAVTCGPASAGSRPAMLAGIN